MEGKTVERSVLLVDDNQSCRLTMARGFHALGFEVIEAVDVDEALILLHDRTVGLLVTELRLGAEPRGGIRLAVVARQLAPEMASVVVTAHGTVSAAVAAIRAGLQGFVGKPATATQVLRAARGELVEDDEGCCFSLEEAKWEYINMVLDSARSMTRAARILGLDRRSLRRMLGKQKPPRALRQAG